MPVSVHKQHASQAPSHLPLEQTQNGEAPNPAQHRSFVSWHTNALRRCAAKVQVDTRVGSSWSRKAGMPPQERLKEQLSSKDSKSRSEAKTRGCGASEHRQSRKSCRWAWRYRARKKQRGDGGLMSDAVPCMISFLGECSASIQIHANVLPIKRQACIHHTSWCHNLHPAAIDSTWANVSNHLISSSQRH